VSDRGWQFGTDGQSARREVFLRVVVLGSVAAAAVLYSLLPVAVSAVALRAGEIRAVPVAVVPVSVGMVAGELVPAAAAVPAVPAWVSVAVVPVGGALPLPLEGSERGGYGAWRVARRQVYVLNAGACGLEFENFSGIFAELGSGGGATGRTPSSLLRCAPLFALTDRYGLARRAGLCASKLGGFGGRGLPQRCGGCLWRQSSAPSFSPLGLKREHRQTCRTARHAALEQSARQSRPVGHLTGAEIPQGFRPLVAGFATVPARVGVFVSDRGRNAGRPPKITGADRVVASPMPFDPPREDGKRAEFAMTLAVMRASDGLCRVPPVCFAWVWPIGAR